MHKLIYKIPWRWRAKYLNRNYNRALQVMHLPDKYPNFKINLYLFPFLKYFNIEYYIPSKKTWNEKQYMWDRQYKFLFFNYHKYSLRIFPENKVIFKHKIIFKKIKL